MKAIILAAGFGNRMKPLTNEKHKTLLTVAGDTIIGRIIDSLVDNAITDIVIVTGYRQEELIQYCKTRYPHLPIAYVHNSRYRETNNIYSMALAFENVSIDSDIILIESDLIYDPSVIKQLIVSWHANAALLDKYSSGMDGTVVTVENDIITNVIPPHLQGPNFDFSDKFETLNIYKFSKDFCNSVFKKLLSYYARVIDDNCYYELILGILIYVQRETIHAEIVQKRTWAEVDDPNDLRVAEFIFNKKKRAEILEEGAGGYWNYDIVDFSFVRNMYFPNPAIISELRNSLSALVQSYGSRQSVLNQKMAWLVLCDRDCIHALNGSSQIYPLLKQWSAGKNALIPAPTFGEYPHVFPGAAHYADSVGISTDEIERKSASSDIVVFVNPNNPTGTLLSTMWIVDFAASNRSKTVIVDESFIEFSDQTPVVQLLESKPLQNVIVVKSLSKSLGMPGVRSGYVYSSNREFMSFVRDATPIWNMNSFAEFTLEVMLKHRKSMQKSFLDTIRDREALSKSLSKVSLVQTVYPSAANFLLISLKGDSDGVSRFVTTELLSKHNLYVKDTSHKFNKNPHLRIAVRLPTENDRLVSALNELTIDQG